MKEMNVDFVGFNLPAAGGQFTTLKCPVCGFEYMHMVYVTVQRKSDTTIVTKDGTSMKTLGSPGRGAILTLGYSGECGHAGELIFEFYKGLIYVEHKLVEQNRGMEDIWRD